MSIVIRVRNESRQSDLGQSNELNIWSTENSGVQRNPGRTEEIRAELQRLREAETQLDDNIDQLDQLLDDASPCLRGIQNFDCLDIGMRGTLRKSEDALLHLISDAEDRKTNYENEAERVQSKIRDLENELEDLEREEQQEQDTLWSTERVSQQSENTLWSTEDSAQAGNPVRDREETALQCERDVLVGELARIDNEIGRIPFSAIRTLQAQNLLEAKRRLGLRIQEIDNQLGSSNDNMWSV